MSSIVTFQALLRRPRLACMAASTVHQTSRLAIRFAYMARRNSEPVGLSKGKSGKRTEPAQPPPLPAYPLPDPAGEDHRVFLYDARQKVDSILANDGPTTRNLLFEEQLPAAGIPTYKGEVNVAPVPPWIVDRDLAGAQPKTITTSMLKNHILRPMIAQMRIRVTTAVAIRRLANELVLPESTAPAEAKAYAQKCLDRLAGIPNSKFCLIMVDWWNTMAKAGGAQLHQLSGPRNTMNSGPLNKTIPHAGKREYKYQQEAERARRVAKTGSERPQVWKEARQERSAPTRIAGTTAPLLRRSRGTEHGSELDRRDR